MFLIVPSAFALSECKPVVEPADVTGGCLITSTWNYTAPCSNWQAVVYNGSADNVINYTFADYGDTGLCVATWNLSSIGSYMYIVGNGDTGNIKIEGDTQMMNWTVIFFLSIFNIGIFLVPLVIRRFTTSESTNYVLRHLFWMGGLIFLWFNTTILRQMASNAGLGIDDQLLGYWWFFTILVCCIILMMVYVTAIGAVKLSQEAEINKRMGGDE